MDWVIEYLLICTVVIAPHPHGNAPSTGLKIYGSYPSERNACMEQLSIGRLASASRLLVRWRRRNSGQARDEWYGELGRG